MTHDETQDQDQDGGLADVPGDAPGDLAHLLTEAAEIEGAQDAKVAEQQQQQHEAAALEARQGLREALNMARMVAAPAFAWWQDFGACWSDRQLDAIADAGAQVMARHGLTMGELFSQWGPYIALLGATVPPGLATYSAIRARNSEPAPVARPPAAGPGLAPGAPGAPEPSHTTAGTRL